MPVYSIVLFLVAAIALIQAHLIYKGNISLLHPEHRMHVTDPQAYGRDMGKAIALLALPLILSAILAFWIPPAYAVGVLIIGLILAVFPLVRCTHRHNGRV